MKLPQMIRNFWIYRRLVALAVLLGIALAFVLSNRETVKVSFPFLGEIGSTSGIVMLTAAAMGAAGCWLVMTFRHAWRDARTERAKSEQGPPAPMGRNDRSASESEGPNSEGPKSAGP